MNLIINMFKEVEEPVDIQRERYSMDIWIRVRNPVDKTDLET